MAAARVYCTLRPRPRGLRLNIRTLKRMTFDILNTLRARQMISPSLKITFGTNVM